MGKAAILTSHDHVIRAKLLNRLGIYKNRPRLLDNVDNERPKQLTRKTQASNSSTFASRSVIGDVVTFRQQIRETRSDKDSALSLPRRTPRIHFNTDVTVVPIPSRHDYSDRIKKFLWSNGQEIQENAERNRVEFATEGWDWHSVLEDDEMYVDASTGELVHPCWFDDELVESPTHDDLESKELNLTKSLSVVEGLDDIRE